MKNLLLAIAALGEAATGVVLVIYPPIAIKLLFGAELIGVGMLLARITGIALIGLGVACWPPAGTWRAVSGLMTYSALVTLYLCYLGFAGGFTGILLWPAVVLHAILTVLLARLFLKTRNPSPA